MPNDDDLVACVGRDNVIEICKTPKCLLYVSCIPRGSQADLCEECYAVIRKQYPDCIEE